MFSKTLFVFFVVNFLSDFSYGQDNEPVFRKDYKYIASQESFYKVHTTPRTFADAKLICAIERASLFYPENESEAKAVGSFWYEFTGGNPGSESIFVGLSDIQTEGQFETVDGRPISEVYSAWKTSQPDNRGDEDCVHMNIRGHFNDYSCDKKANFICKKRLQSLERKYHCGMPKLEYTINNDTGKCYKLHSTPLTWTEAFAVCHSEYASLAVISNHKEADALVNLTRFTSTLRLHIQYQRGIYHLGFYNRFSDHWQTVRGTPLNVDADLWFDNYQPEINLNGECGAMFFNGRLINIDCNVMKSLFICERKAEIMNPCGEENYY